VTDQVGLPAFRRRALSGALLQVVLAAGIGLFLVAVTNGPGDAVPRPLVIAVLYATPGMIAAFGAIGGRRSLVVAAALLAIPGSVLSFAGVTLIFVFPGVFFVAAAVAMPRGKRSARSMLSGAGLGIVEFGLVLAAGWGVLIGFTRPACYQIPGGSGCSSAAISPEGVATAGLLLTMALGLAAIAAATGNRPHRATPTSRG
jgi:hypothetical protein